HASSTATRCSSAAMRSWSVTSLPLDRITVHCHCMRLATCLSCRTITKLSDFEGGNPDHDVVLQDWIDRHLHAVPVDEIPGPLHPGAKVAVVDMPDITTSPKFLAMPIEDQERALERIEGEAVFNLQ